MTTYREHPVFQYVQKAAKANGVEVAMSDFSIINYGGGVKGMPVTYAIVEFSNGIQYEIRTERDGTYSFVDCTPFFFEDPIHFWG